MSTSCSTILGSAREDLGAHARESVQEGKSWLVKTKLSKIQASKRHTQDTEMEKGPYRRWKGQLGTREHPWCEDI